MLQGGTDENSTWPHSLNFGRRVVEARVCSVSSGGGVV